MRPELRLLRTALDRMESGEPGFVAIIDLSGVPQSVDPVFLRALIEMLSGRQDAAKADRFELGRDAIVLLSSLDRERDLLGRLARLSQTVETQGMGHVAARHLRLPQDIEALLGFAQGRLTDAPVPITSGNPAVALDQENGLSDLGDFAALERTLYRADIAALVREQPIFRVTDTVLEQWARELWVSIEALERQFQVPLSDNPWLFGRVTELLDRRMVYHLVRDRWSETEPLSINLHCTSVLSEDFGKLMRDIGGRLAAGLTAELPFAEYRLDPRSFAEAAGLLRRYGVAVALDLVPWREFIRLEAPATPLRAIKVFGTAEELFEATPETRDGIRAHADQLVLIRCDRVRLIDAGRQCGFQLFQGRMVADWVIRERRDRLSAERADEERREREAEIDTQAPESFAARLKKLFRGDQDG